MMGELLNFYCTLFTFSEVATKILPNLLPVTIDPDKSVRDPAFKTIKGFMTKLERVSDDPALKEQFGELFIYLYWPFTVLSLKRGEGGSFRMKGLHYIVKAFKSKKC